MQQLNTKMGGQVMGTLKIIADSIRYSYSPGKIVRCLKLYTSNIHKFSFITNAQILISFKNSLKTN